MNPEAFTRSASVHEFTQRLSFQDELAVPDLTQLKLDICEIGRRIYQRQFASANDGNITIRVSENEVLCTPTMQCKGFLKPDDIAMIDMSGNQLSGNKKRSSEALLHLEIYRQRNDIHSVVHCHPPHATAFAIAREAIPQCVLPEVEAFLGEVPIAPYETPGSQRFADTILPFVAKTNVIVLANHGTVSYAADVERAYWWTEILDSYCRTLILAKQLGHVHYLPADKCQELLEQKAAWAMTDARLELGTSCEVCNHPIFKDTWPQSAVARRAFAAQSSDDDMIHRIADEVVKRLRS